MKCSKCGYDEDAPVLASWTFVIARPVVSLNRGSTNKGANRWEYASERSAWAWHLRAHRLDQRIPLATELRRLTLTRLIGPRCRAFDRDNLIGGLKPVVDAMVRELLLTGDAEQHAEVHYLQEKHKLSGLHVLLEVLG
jgi:hypothetical protein